MAMFIEFCLVRNMIFHSFCMFTDFHDTEETNEPRKLFYYIVINSRLKDMKLKQLLRKVFEVH